MKSRLMLYLIGLSAFVGSLGQNLYSPLLTQVQEQLNTTSYLVNLSVSIFTIALAVMQIVFGPLADKKGRKTVLLPAILVYALASIGCAYAPSIGLLLVFRTLQGMASAAIPVISAAMIGDLYQGKELAKGMGTYQLMLMLAPALGPLLGGFIGEGFGYQAVFIFLAIVSVAIFAANAGFLPETKPKESSKKPFNLRQFSAIVQNRASAAVLLFGFFQCLVYFVYLIFLPQVLHNNYAFEPGRTGSILLAMSVFSIIGIKFGGAMMNRLGMRKSLFYAFLLHALTVLLFTFTAELSLYMLIFDVCLFGLVMGLTMSMPTTLLAEIFPEDRATAIGVYNLIRYMGMAIGPMIGTLLYSGGSIIPLFLTSGALYLGSIFIGSVLLKDRKSYNVEPN